MQVWACVTTRNRVSELDRCLTSLWSSTAKPRGVVVSDDSPDPVTRRRNREVVDRYPETVYLVGRRAGVCANRNRVVDAVPLSPDAFVAFVDDDITVEPDFVECGLTAYGRMTPAERSRTILAGVCTNTEGQEISAGRLTFRGYFRASDVPQSVVIVSAMFPRDLFTWERWDERIFFGYEDAELCLRALNRGYRIQHCPPMRVRDRGTGASTLKVHAIGRLTDYDRYAEAARLYVGVKRYREINPSPLRLLAFLVVYAVHLPVFLLRMRALRAWPEILRTSGLFGGRWAPAVPGTTGRRVRL